MKCVCCGTSIKRYDDWAYAYVGPRRTRRWSCSPCNKSGAFDRWLDAQARERYDLASAAGRDAGNRSARAAGRKAWTLEDYNAACREFDALLPVDGDL